MDSNEHLRKRGMSDDEIVAFRREAVARLDALHARLEGIPEDEIEEALRLDAEARSRGRKRPSIAGTRDA